jgi:hypothetical protein
VSQVQMNSSATPKIYSSYGPHEPLQTDRSQTDGNDAGIIAIRNSSQFSSCQFLSSSSVLCKLRVLAFSSERQFVWSLREVAQGTDLLGF